MRNLGDKKCKRILGDKTFVDGSRFCNDLLCI